MSLLKTCQNFAKQDNNILNIILYGSRARGDFKKTSDYDIIFIIKSPIKSPNKEYKIKQHYENQIARKLKIDEHLIQTSIWPLKMFKEEHKKGNSFVYCTLRDGKILYSKQKLNLKQPKNSQKAAVDRLNFAKRNITNIEFSLKHLKKHKISNFDIEHLGYSSMHLCWTVCMFNNFYPISKYTILKECKKYFTTKQFKNIKKTYNLYATQNSYKNIKKKTFIKLFKSLKKTIKITEKKYKKQNI
ncbi:hypothetical protein CL618_00610 [archaeon]|nr:hypothetical protein [archaeon]|tara:strand:- start:5804 stop:6535 length:732 start_codon:yes stop_codon:yes gene_type:complete